MSYEDLEEARAKRAAKEEATAAKGKGKRGRKRKSATPEAEVEAQAEANSQEEETGSSVSKDKVVWMNEVEPAKALGVPWRAPGAKMY